MHHQSSKRAKIKFRGLTAISPSWDVGREDRAGIILPPHVDATTVPVPVPTFRNWKSWEGKGRRQNVQAQGQFRFRFRFRGTSSGRQIIIAVTRVGLERRDGWIGIVKGRAS